MLVVMAWDSPTGRWETIGQSVGRWQLTASLDTAMEAVAAVIVILICYNRRQRRQSSTRVSTGHQTLSEGIGVGRGPPSLLLSLKRSLYDQMVFTKVFI